MSEVCFLIPRYLKTLNARLLSQLESRVKHKYFVLHGRFQYDLSTTNDA